MLDIQTYNLLRKRYADYDREDMKYTFSIHYTTLTNTDQIMKVENGKGSEAFNRHLDELIKEYDDVATIIVTDYRGIKRKNASQINPPVTLVVREQERPFRSAMPQAQIVQQPEIPSQTVPQNFTIRDHFNGFAGLSGHDALDKYITMREDSVNQNLQIRLLEETNKKLQEELSETRTQKKALEEELEETLEQNDQLETLVNDLKKYVPDGKFQIMGLDGLKLLGNVLEHAATSFIKKHPKALSGFLGEEALAGILSDTPQVPQAAPSPAPALSPEEEERLNYATMIFDWLQKISLADFKSVYIILSYVQTPEKLVQVFDYIKTQQNHDNNGESDQD